MKVEYPHEAMCNTGESLIPYIYLTPVLVNERFIGDIVKELSTSDWKSSIHQSTGSESWVTTIGCGTLNCSLKYVYYISVVVTKEFFGDVAVEILSEHEIVRTPRALDVEADYSLYYYIKLQCRVLADF